MDPTAQALLVALAGALVVGCAVLAWAISDRQQNVVPPAPEPVIPQAVAAVLSVLRSSAVVVDDAERVLRASAPAYALGLVRGTSLTNVELSRMVGEVRRDGQIRETELTLERRNATPRQVSVRVAPLGSRQVLVLAEDRTRERRIEAIRRDFVANVSHELKTPVGALRLLADAVDDAADDPEAVRRFAERMHTESERLSRLVQQVIELSRLQGDERIDAPLPVAVDDILSVAVDTSAIDAVDRNVSVRIDGERGLKVMGNEEQLTTAVANLVANAVAYSREGTQVVVTAKFVDDHVEISVFDQGIGIPSTDLDRIFERFYRVDPARHRSTGGTGLGLSIVKHVAATHGGEVRVWSVQGEGSTFTLRLPSAATPDHGSEDPDHPHSVDGEPAGPDQEDPA